MEFVFVFGIVLPPGRVHLVDPNANTETPIEREPHSVELRAGAHDGQVQL